MSAIEPRKELESLKAYVPGDSVESVASDVKKNVIKMASNENPLGSPINVSELKEAVQKSYFYPDLTRASLLKKIAKNEGCAVENLIIGNGSDDILQMIALSLLNQGDEVIVSSHTFSVYTHVARLMGASIVEVPMADYANDLEAMKQAVTAETKILFLANPNNPTGTFLKKAELETFLAAMPRSVLVVIDEAYIQYADQAEVLPISEMMDQYNVIVLRTFSKIYGLAGFRIGYGVANTTIIGLLQKVRQPFNVNQLALSAAELALEKDDYIAESLKNNALGKKQIEQALTQMGVSFIPTQANFICLFLSIDAETAKQKFLEQGIIIRPLTSFGLPNAIRVTVGLAAENDRFISALESIIADG